MHPPDLVLGGFFLGHPSAPVRLPAGAAPVAGALQQQRRLLHRRVCTDLDGARALAACLAEPVTVHGLWLPTAAVDDLLAADPEPASGEPAVHRLLRQRVATAIPEATAAGWDVLGFLGEDCHRWQQDRFARAVAQRLGLGLGVGPEEAFVAEAEAASRLAAALDSDEFGPPVQWLAWWHTHHAA